MSTAPDAHLLGNGRYRVILSGFGAGCSVWDGLALTRWSGDPTRDHEGLALILRDLESGLRWGAGLHPIAGKPERYRSRAGPGVASIERADDGIETRLDVAVAPEVDAEVRLLTLTERSGRPRRLDLTSYLEVALNDPAADAGHPAFSKLFVQTERDPSTGTLLARRRARSPDDRSMWLGHRLAPLTRRDPGAVEFETDRARFIGRGRDPANPAALDRKATLSGTAGNVIDPILAARIPIRLAAGETRRVVATAAAGPSRAAVLDALAAVETRGPAAVLDAAETRAREDLARLDLDAAWLARLPRLTGAVAYRAMAAITGLDPVREKPALARALAAAGVTGRNPIVLARVETAHDRRDLAELEKLAEWWGRGGLAVDLVVVPDRAGAVDRAVRTTLERAAAITLATARHERHRRPGAGRLSPPFHPAEPPARATVFEDPDPVEGFNGLGGFSPDGREYRIRLDWRDGRLRLPPQPWANVIANPEAGMIVTERGVGAIWTVNSRENRLTPWRNDPVSDPASVALLLGDWEAGVFWSPLPGPAPGPGSYQVRHGFGWTEWRHRSFGLAQRTVAFAAESDPAVVLRIELANLDDRRRSLSLLAAAELVLGVDRAATGRWVVTARDGATGTVLAVNRERGEFAARVGFAALGADRPLTIRATGDRAELFGRGGSFAAPAAARMGEPLGERFGAGLDPAIGFGTGFVLEPGERIALALVLGETPDRAAALRIADRLRDPAAAEAERARVAARWTGLADRLEIRTPAPAIDRLVNGWLGYQNLSCRIWGRSALYQSGGAYGFRDQLQDAVALVHQLPALTREQILLHAAHQFPEGDVLHWWHPPTAKGIRTGFSDDLLWLPYAVTSYLAHTGDRAILGERVPFVEGPRLEPGEDERFFTPTRSRATADLYHHCCLALDRSLTTGAHGLPLMGTGDWNDGMNRVGREGRGESVWLGFFLYRILGDFLPLTALRDDAARTARYRDCRSRLGAALNRGGWDGAWYRRAYYDDGEPLGSAGSDECRIDAIAQAWAVISGAAPAERAGQALDAAVRELVDRRHGIIRLLTPAFDATPHDPGYIKGYLPGVRENGGQYTHGALWLIRALAEAGRVEDAAPLLEMVSPAAHGADPERVARYQVEPYVIAADVYGVAPHNGRGGWTWYTGSAGWMQRVALESILGLTVEAGTAFRLAPAIPAGWPGFSIRYRLPGDGGGYRFVVEQSNPRPERTEIAWDGPPASVADGAARIPIVAGSGWKTVTVRLGRDLLPRYRPG